MDSLGFLRILLISASILVFYLISTVTAGDIVHQDDLAPKKPGCENDFVLVKAQTWIDGSEDAEFVGVGARFGRRIVSKEKNANQTHVVFANPRDCCAPLKTKLYGDVVIVDRGSCRFTAKANNAEAAGASALLIINNQKELYKMVCEPDETDLDITIPAVMLPQDAGATLEKMLTNSSKVSVQLYSPRRPAVDVAEVFLWLMAIGTILCASYWSAWSAREAAIEHDKLLKGLHTCLVALLSRWFQRAGDSYVKVPFLGPISYLTLGVSPFCIVFAVLWAVYRERSLAWIGQDVLGIALIITVLQIVHVPNLKVGTVLLSCAFLYDIFWVFVSKKLFDKE